MLVVLGILALVMTMTVPFLAGSPAKAELTATAREIAAALRETRGRAIERGHTEAFLIDAAAGTFRGADGGRIRHVPSDIRLFPLTAPEDRRRDALASIRFFADGSSTGGGVRLIQGNRRSEVLVDWLTGRVSLPGITTASR